MSPDKNSFDKKYSRKDYVFSFNYDQKILSDILRYKKSGKVLDLGCGEGGLTLKLAEKSFDVTCIDISKIAIQKIKDESKKRKLKVNAMESDLENYKINKSYDGILQFLGMNGEKYIKKIKKIKEFLQYNPVLLEVFLAKMICVYNHPTPTSHQLVLHHTCKLYKESFELFQIFLLFFYLVLSVWHN
jgi:SAM-dependent methyltransferase